MSGNPSDQDTSNHCLAPSTAHPVVSVVMANFRGEAQLAAAMTSVLAQTEQRLELIVCDDASDDDSVKIARRIAETDPRVHVIASTRNEGPAATRNKGLDSARGEWISVVDSDDLIHPDRLARLITAAKSAGADLAADDLVYFGAMPEPQGRTLLQSMKLAAPMMLDPADYLRSNDGKSSLPAFGYLKPVIRRCALADQRYDTQLRIGEDHDLVMRLLIQGARLLLLPDPLYAYRRHSGSISHRLSVSTVEAMLQAHRHLPPMPDPETRAAAKAVDRHLRRTLRYERLVSDIKARRWLGLMPRLADPTMVARLMESLQDRHRRGTAHPRQDFADLQQPLPFMPPAGEAWRSPPADGAAQIASISARGGCLPANLPNWALWLFDATAGSSTG
ncbi:glycosyltransferase [Paracoccus sp. JM45]|uniref:glycosyltransferase family 2 protein n=1 Tax=Paracoccus sp. JM45 TaxID=2283626 RepID=UPI001603BC06|nr:glycosyltransferase [Paracoccus sp. JM45]